MVLLLLAARCVLAPADLNAVGGPAFFAALLGESDPRIRRCAAALVLRHLFATRLADYRAALRLVVARAQQANDGALLTDAYRQLRTILDLRLIDLEQ